jgi:ATP-dependent Lon protease
LTRKERIGVVPGLAYTAVGGELLFIEATAMTGDRPMTLTGQLGDVMKESAQAALSFLRSNCRQLGVEPECFKKQEIHIHVPSGATPKDGPSAGITIAVALASLFTGRPVKPFLAMTGEITLRGEILPIGGLKEKLLAAYRGGIKTVILPAQNRKDTVELPKEVRQGLKLKYFAEMMPAITFALDAPSEGRRGKPRASNKRPRGAGEKAT